MINLTFFLHEFSDNNEVYKKADGLRPDIGCECELSVKLKAIKASDITIYVSGTVEGFLTLECSRCLFLYRHPISINVACEMKFNGDRVSMADEIRELAILEIPMKPLCSEDCLGICPVCGRQNKKDDACACQEPSKNLQADFIKRKWEDLFNKTKRR
ncbi:MAG: YceD family protein [Elusimicrobiota bacterium]|jgi:uncharacterized protein|nr:YceD family protein [Elusimicrobiota bacterium]